MSSYEEEKPRDRLDLGGQSRKKQQQQAGFTNWREANRMATVDDFFKTIVAAKKGNPNRDRTSNSNSSTMTDSQTVPAAGHTQTRGSCLMSNM